MRTVTHLSIILGAIVSLTVLGCGQGTQHPYCDNPAPLLGEFDPRGPGYIVGFNEDVEVVSGRLKPAT